MDKITHQVRAEHWTKIMNECITAECLKLPGAEQMGSQKSSSSTGRGSCAGSFREFPEFIITGNCRTASGAGASDSKDGLFY